MPHEILGELLVGAIELGADGMSENNKKSGCGCIITIVAIIFLVGAIYYVTELINEKPKVGLITKKLSNNRILLKIGNSEDIYTITNELYLNKKEGDSLILQN